MVAEPAAVRPLVLIGAAAVAMELGIDPAPDHGALSALLAPLDVHVAGLDESGGPLWPQAKVQSAKPAAQQEWARMRSLASMGPMLEQLRDVLAEQAGVVLQRALERHLSPALNDLDERLDKFGAGMQALNRQSSAQGDLLRDVGARQASAMEEARGAQAAVRRELENRLAAVEQACQSALAGMLQELVALRLSVNEVVSQRRRT